MSMEGAGGTKRSFIQEYVEQNEKKNHHAVREIATRMSSPSSKQILGPGGRP